MKIHRDDFAVRPHDGRTLHIEDACNRSLKIIEYVADPTEVIIQCAGINKNEYYGVRLPKAELWRIVEVLTELMRAEERK